MSETQVNDHQDRLQSISATRRLVNQLHSRGLITRTAHTTSLDLLFPAHAWGLWLFRLLLAVGSALVLSGIVYFFAFNWDQIPDWAKLAGIQTGIAMSVLAATYLGLSRPSGKTLVLVSSVLVGVFLAVFGQIYQTGADAYSLFVSWALLILPWTLIAEMNALWILWIAVGNTALALYLDELIKAREHVFETSFTVAGLFNLFFLALRESLSKKFIWLQARWTRILLVFVILLAFLVPEFITIVEPEDATKELWVGCILGLLLHPAAFFYYRYKKQDIWVLALVALSACSVATMACVRLCAEVFDGKGAPIFLFGGCITLAIFTVATIYLRRISKSLGGKSV